MCCKYSYSTFKTFSAEYSLFPTCNSAAYKHTVSTWLQLHVCVVSSEVGAAFSVLKFCLKNFKFKTYKTKQKNKKTRTIKGLFILNSLVTCLISCWIPEQISLEFRKRSDWVLPSLFLVSTGYLHGRNEQWLLYDRVVTDCNCQRNNCTVVKKVDPQVTRWLTLGVCTFRR